jgi:hypothetical protein
MARRIGAGAFIQFPVTQLNNFTGDFTVAVLAKAVADGTAISLLRTFNAGFTAGWELGRTAANRLFFRVWTAASGSPQVTSTSFTFVVADGWCVLGARKVAGTGTAVLLWKNPVPDGARASDTPGTLVDYDTGATGCDISNTNVDLAIAGVWKGFMDNAALDLLDHDFYGWTQGPIPSAPITPRAIWRFNQAAISTPVPDYLGGGEDQSGISGTSVVADPGSYDMSIDKYRPHLLPVRTYLQAPKMAAVM